MIFYPRPSRLTHTLQCANVLHFCLCGHSFPTKLVFIPSAGKTLNRWVFSGTGLWPSNQAICFTVSRLGLAGCQPPWEEPHCRSWTRAGCPGPLWRFSGVSAPHVQCYTAPQPPLWWVSGGTNDNFGCKRSHRWPRIISFSLGDSRRLGSVCKRSWRRTGLQCCCWGVSNVLTRKMLLREENQQDGKTMSSWRFLLSS